MTCQLFEGARVDRWEIDGAPVSAEVYYADRERISQSALKIINSSPRSHAEGVERRDTDALRRGRRLHHAVLQPEIWAAECRAMDSAVVRPKFEGKGARTTQPAEWLASLPPGTQIIAADEKETWAEERDRVDAMAMALHNHELAGALLARDAEAEMPLTWTDPETGLPCKCMVDHVSVTPAQITIVDVKTDRDPSPGEFPKAVARWRYHWQRAWYGDAVSRFFEPVVGPPWPVRFYFAVVRNAPPYEVAVYELDHDALVTARRQIREVMARVKDYTETRDWRAPWERGREPLTLSLPRWAER